MCREKSYGEGRGRDNVIGEGGIESESAGRGVREVEKGRWGGDGELGSSWR